MSRHETEMTRWFWRLTGGKLFEEFMVVPRGANQGRRLVDGLIVHGLPTRIARIGERIDLRELDVVVVQAKNARLGMNLMGQTLFSARLVARLAPRSVRAVALCGSDDVVLRPLLELFAGCEVRVCPPEVCQRLKARG
ncbi:MAG: hypothetical protein WC809_19970 [Sinimarinibacterium sp.]|jgi:hypothetical protein